ncbi:uncharacterized protein LOC124435929 [Xenia sp. Carnegie-2017]|uniref:uncharacterized protein LOC124435929 n=1 Tax=Xenia sp. Carnegie-2017 TaxID=2897299 RepID=UPI001F040DA8|nr:uncharacterized protein LOC124435929 [Xenia sp. Carnegie-2017]
MKTGLSFIIPKPNDENNFGTSETSDYSPSYSAHLDGTSMPLVSPNKYLPMSLNEIKAKSERVKKRLLASVSDRDRIMELTVKQHESKLWYDVRQPRITASKVKRCLIKPTTSPTKAIADVLNYHTPIQTKAMKDGIESEAGILKKYELISGNTVRKVGFIISSTHPFLGASPDGITNDNVLLEVKKVTAKENESFMDTLCRLYIYKKKNGKLYINNNHKYYYQMQQQLFCAGGKVCHFVVSNGIWVHIDEICFDEVFWRSLIGPEKRSLANDTTPFGVIPTKAFIVEWDL